MIGWILAGCVFSEYAGYFLHRLLHSDRVRFLSKNHMIHHLLVYGPKDLRSDHYRSPTIGNYSRAAISGLGLEWLVPVGIVVAAILGVFAALQIQPRHQIAFIGSALGWSYLMFDVVHNAMHVHNPILMRIPFVRRWFIRARRLHDIHHIQIDSRGLMNRNFGICFFFLDRVFGTLEKQAKPLDQQSYRQALHRYSFIGSGN